MNCWYRIPLLRALPLKNGITSQKKNKIEVNTMAKKTKNNTITIKQSKNLGTDLTNIMSGLQALRHHANTLMIAKQWTTTP